MRFEMSAAAQDEGDELRREASKIEVTWVIANPIAGDPEHWGDGNSHVLQ